jgi:hypothetical protein
MPTTMHISERTIEPTDPMPGSATTNCHTLLHVSRQYVVAPATHTADTGSPEKVGN